MSITLMIFVLVILLFGFDLTGQVKTRRKHNYGLQQINLVAFKDISRTSHPTKEVVSVVPRVATQFLRTAVPPKIKFDNYSWSC